MKKDIFSEVTFLNEGIFLSTIGGVTLSLLLLPGAICMIGETISKIKGSSAKHEINNKLRDYAKKNCRGLEKMKIKFISSDKLAQIARGNKKDIDIIDKNSLICAIAYIDNERKPISYMIYDASAYSFKYEILDNLYSDRNSEDFIKASFEFKLNLYGDNLKKVVGNIKNIGLVETDKDTKKEFNRISENEKENKNKLHSLIEEYLKSNNICESYEGTLIPIGKMDDFLEGNWYFDGSGPEFNKFYNKIYSTFNKIANQEGFKEIKEREEFDDYDYHLYGESNKYPNLCIVLDYSCRDDSSINYSINVNNLIP